MVILGSDGEKWACEACLKGHRVSSCTHRDRQLFHVNKKGRPVSQCPHCRGLRKSRSAHNRCVCAEHGLGRDDRSGGGRCGCMTDKQPCTCSVKRDSIPGDDLQKAAARNLTHRRAHSHGKPSMLSRRSDSGPPRPHIGQHPPLQRHNNAAHESGFPYTIPKFTTSTPTIDLAQSSTDSLPLPPVPRPGGLHRASLSTSNLPQSFAPMLPSNAPADHVRSVSIGHRAPSINSLPTPGEEWQDNGFLSAASPPQPPRYSFQDLSSFSFPDFGADNSQFSGQTVWSQPVPQYGVGQMYRHTPFAASTGQLPEWPELSDAESPQTYPASTILETPQRSSVVSMDQPGLTHSPSNTASDAESYAQHQEHGAQGTAQQAMMQPQPWDAKDFVDPQSLEMGPASYTSTATDLPFRPSDNEYWPDYFHSAAASSTPESMQADMQIKTESESAMTPFSSAPGFENVDFGGNMAEMNFNAWDTFTVQHNGNQGFEHHP